LLQILKKTESNKNLKTASKKYIFFRGERKYGSKD